MKILKKEIMKSDVIRSSEEYEEEMDNDIDEEMDYGY